MTSTPAHMNINLTIFVPDFIIPYWNDESHCLKEHAHNLKKKDWLTQELIDDIGSAVRIHLVCWKPQWYHKKIYLLVNTGIPLGYHVS